MLPHNTIQVGEPFGKCVAKLIFLGLLYLYIMRKSFTSKRILMLLGNEKNVRNFSFHLKNLKKENIQSHGDC